MSNKHDVEVKFLTRGDNIEKLNEVFFKWQKEYGYEPTFYKITNVEEIIV